MALLAYSVVSSVWLLTSYKYMQHHLGRALFGVVGATFYSNYAAFQLFGSDAWSLQLVVATAEKGTSDTVGTAIKTSTAPTVSGVSCNGLDTSFFL